MVKTVNNFYQNLAKCGRCHSVLSYDIDDIIVGIEWGTEYNYIHCSHCESPVIL